MNSTKCIYGYKVLLCFLVVSGHMYNFIGGRYIWGIPMLGGIGARAVDGFFLITAFLTMLSYEKRPCNSKKFIMKRFWRLYPVYIVCLLLAYITEPIRTGIQEKILFYLTGNNIGAWGMSYVKEPFASVNDFLQHVFLIHGIFDKTSETTILGTFSLSGKSGKTTFNVGLGYLDQNGLMKVAKHDDFRRWNGSIRLSTEINKYITARAGANYSKRNKRYAYATNSTTADPWLYLYRWDSTYPMGYDENGNEMRSPASEVHQANTANKEDNYLSFNVGATLQITKDWKFDIDYTYAGEDQIWKKNGTKYTAADTWTAPVKRLDGNGNQIYVNNKGEVVSAGSQGAMPAYDLNYRQYTADGGNPDHIRRQVTNAKRHTLNITTDYNWQINKQNNLKVLAGMNRTDWESEDNWSQITNLTDINNLSWDKTIGTQTSSGNLYWDGQLGFFGRVNYNFMDKYLLEANVRYDGSSKFPSSLCSRVALPPIR